MSKESIKRYKKNLRFFKKEHPEIFNHINTQTNEDIEIVKQNGKINLKVDSKLIYPDNYLDSLDKKIESFLDSDIESFTIIPGKAPKYYYKPLHDKYLNKIVDGFKKIEKDDKVLVRDKNSLFYLIIYGIGLGQHIEKILEKIEVKNLLLVEKI